MKQLWSYMDYHKEDIMGAIVIGIIVLVICKIAEAFPSRDPQRKRWEDLQRRLVESDK